MIGRIVALVFLLASTASAQPLVFGAAQRIPAPYGPVLAVSSPLLATNGDGGVLAAPKNLLVPAPEGVGAVASDGAGYLAIWNDGITLKAIVLDAAGSVREITDLWWADAPTNAPDRPLIAFGGGNYLVVWRD